MSRSQDALWRVSEDELRDMNPVRARDLIIECFFRTQSQALRVSSERHRDVRDRELRDTMCVALRLRFEDLGLDFENPTADCIGTIADELTREAEIWGTPVHVLEHHIGELRKIESCLRGGPDGRRPAASH
ncbi:MAG: hypothetical protein Q8K99_11530 [Actinomycetota bacterium]|nr:hypothetical protein [Actinomycetota bacterium]